MSPGSIFADRRCSTSEKWLNHPHLSGYADFKPVQLSEARRAGLVIPRTLITNDPLRAKAFVEETPSVIYKPMSSAVLPSGVEGGSMLYASVVSKDDMADVASVAGTAHMFQERIDSEPSISLSPLPGSGCS